MKLYKRYLLLHIQTELEYKTSFLLTAIGQFLVSCNVFIGIYFMFQRFSTVKGYSFEECLFCFSLFLLSFSLAEMFFRGFDQFASMISNGEFDRILLRPKSLVLQVLGSKIEFTRIGRMLQALVMFVYVLLRQPIEWTILKACITVFMILGGTVLFAALFVLYATICFFTLEGLEIFNIFTDGAREFGKYPLAIYGKNILLFSTFLIPYACIQYYPFLYLTDHTTNVMVAFTPIAVLLFCIPVHLFWNYGIKHYQSKGS